MKPSSLAVLLLIAAVTGRNNNTFPDEENFCVEAVLNRVHISTDKVPIALLATTRILEEINEEGLWRDLDWESWSREKLELNEDVLSIALASPKTAVVIYQEDIHSGGNYTSLSYLRNLEVAFDKNTSGFWAPPFWDCILNKWVFGYTTSIYGTR